MNLEPVAPRSQPIILRRLPMYGEVVADSKINFYWPTEEILAQEMRTHRCTLNEISLKSLEFKIIPHEALSSVKCTLSTGRASETYEKPGANHQKKETVNIDPNVIRKVQAQESKEVGNGWVATIRFKDARGEQVSAYNPMARKIVRGEIYALQEDE